MTHLPDWPFRSLLFVPANREDLVHKTARYAPEAVILDLEDAVPPDQKPAARAAIKSLVTTLEAQGIAAFVRVNSLEEGGLEDAREAVCGGLRGLVVPKVQGAADIRQLDLALSYEEGRQGIPQGQVHLIGLPETAVGLRNSHEIAAASARVKGLMTPVSGPIGADVARAVGYLATKEGLEQLYLTGKVILDCRAAGAPFPVAGIIGMQVDDLEAVDKLIARAKTMGFSGAALIHPSHVALANAALRPGEREIEYSRQLLAAAQTAISEGRGAFRFEGAMIDLAMLAGARDIVAEADRRRAAQDDQ